MSLISAHTPMTGQTASLLWLGKIVGVSFAGGVVGSISGLGGGIVIVPVLTIFLGMPIQEAIAASIVSVIAVSSGAGSVYVKDRITNVRIAMFLELSTAAGALFGAAVLTRWVNPQSLSILFGSILLLSLAADHHEDRRRAARGRAQRPAGRVPEPERLVFRQTAQSRGRLQRDGHSRRDRPDGGRRRDFRAARASGRAS